MYTTVRKRSARKYRGPLKPGMVITVEPGIYFKSTDLLVPEELRGIGDIEGDILITADGYEILSDQLPVNQPASKPGWPACWPDSVGRPEPVRRGRLIQSPEGPAESPRRGGWAEPCSGPWCFSDSSGWAAPQSVWASPWSAWSAPSGFWSTLSDLWSTFQLSETAGWAGPPKRFGIADAGRVALRSRTGRRTYWTRLETMLPVARGRCGCGLAGCRGLPRPGGLPGAAGEALVGQAGEGSLFESTCCGGVTDWACGCGWTSRVCAEPPLSRLRALSAYSASASTS